MIQMLIQTLTFQMLKDLILNTLNSSIHNSEGKEYINNILSFLKT